MSKNKGESVSQIDYSRVISNLMYLMSCTIPDIAYAISKLSRYTSNLRAKYWQGIVRLLKYFLVIMGCTIWDIQLYLNDTVMWIGYLTLKTQNPLVVMCLH